MRWLVIIVLVCILRLSGSFILTTKVVRASITRQKSDLLADSTPSPVNDAEVRGRIDSIVSQNKVVLFMKGNRVVPKCGFSGKACRILDAVRTTYETIDVLEDDDIRSGIKAYSNWPTIPQLYINKEFVGGSDIMMEMYESGELAQLLK